MFAHLNFPSKQICQSRFIFTGVPAYASLGQLGLSTPAGQFFFVVYQAVTRNLNFFCEKHFNSSVSDLSKKKEGPGADLILLCFVLSIFEMTL